MDGTVKEQRPRMKKVTAQKVNTTKTQADRSCKNLLTPVCSSVYNLLESEFPVIIVKNGAVRTLIRS
jgi:hypothetical protein